MLSYHKGDYKTKKRQFLTVRNKGRKIFKNCTKTRKKKKKRTMVQNKNNDKQFFKQMKKAYEITAYKHAFSTYEKFSENISIVFITYENILRNINVNSYT